MPTELQLDQHFIFYWLINVFHAWIEIIAGVTKRWPHGLCKSDAGRPAANPLRPGSGVANTIVPTFDRFTAFCHTRLYDWSTCSTRETSAFGGEHWKTHKFRHFYFKFSYFIFLGCTKNGEWRAARPWHIPSTLRRDFEAAGYHGVGMIRACIQLN